jgi:pimeloyl-ACP methyl ester carboxylesterase
MKELVITIHGVNPNRGWQPAVHKVLAPHFEYMGYDYNDYDSFLGPIRAVANITTLALAVLLIIGALIAVRPWGSALLIIGAGAILLILSGFSAWYKRTKCAERLKTAIDNRLPVGMTHVIAHSLGTYLIGRILKKFPDIQLGNVILVSTVLPRSYPWKRILTENPMGARNVRSEFGRSDIVVRAVGWISWLVRDLGNAGLRGFLEVEDWVHTSSSPITACLVCGGRAVPVPVHNVPLREFGHSNQFLGRRHAQLLWLPYLWNFGVGEFSQYLEVCLKVTRLESEERFSDADIIIRDLWAKTYSWTSGQSLNDYAKGLIAARVARGSGLKGGLSIDDVFRESKYRLHLVTALAVEECSRSGQVNEWKARALNPAIAIARIVKRFVAEDE